MAIPTVAPNRVPQPFFLALKKDTPRACTSSQRMKRTAAAEEELGVFSAEKYFSGAMDMLNPWKISPGKKFSLPSPPHPTSTAAPSMGRKNPILSFMAFFRKSPPPSTSTARDRSSWVIRGDPEVDIFSESSSDLFELDTLSIRNSAFVDEKLAKCASRGGPLQVGCRGREALNVAAGAHKASANRRPGEWDSRSRAERKLGRALRISALSLR